MLKYNATQRTAGGGGSGSGYNGTKGAPLRDGAALAAEINVSDDAVWRLLRKEGIQFARMRTWCVSTDPEFAAKASDIVGRYLNPPENAVVICVDEKPSM